MQNRVQMKESEYTKDILKCAKVTHSSLLLGDVLVVMYLILYVHSFKIVTIS